MIKDISFIEIVFSESRLRECGLLYFCLGMLKSFLKYRKSRLNAHGIHSPFVFEFYNAIVKLASSRNTAAVEHLRKDLYKNKTVIDFEDFGAGSRKKNTRFRTISSIAKNAGIKPKYGRLLAQLVDYYEINSALELGTSVGLGAHYLLNGNENLQLISIEGCRSVADFAVSQFKGNSNVQLIQGEFSEVISHERFNTLKFDLIYIDGNHQMNPTLHYFEFALNHMQDEAFIVFDDIHWSKEMETAWEKIIDDDRVNVTLDLFQFGIVCLRKGQRKQHFVIKY